MRKLLALGLAVMLAGACADQPTSPADTLDAPDIRAAATTTKTNEIVPIGIAVFVPCANGGLGEVVQAAGYLHINTHTTINDNRVHVKTHSNPQGVTGVGLTTGDKYQGTGVTQDTNNFDAVDGFPFTFTFVNNFRFIGQGRGNNYTVHENFHVTVNANGETTTVVDNFKAECK